MPPAFVLSQDQTLRKINYFIRKSDSKHLKLCCFDYIGKPMSQIEFSRLHRTIQFSISCHFFVASHNISFIISLVKRSFEDFWDFFISTCFQRPEPLKATWDIIYHKNWFCQTQFLIFFDFLSTCLACLSELRRRKTRHNIPLNFTLSNDFEVKFAFFCKKSSSTRERVSKRTMCAGGVLLWWQRRYAGRRWGTQSTEGYGEVRSWGRADRHRGGYQSATELPTGSRLRKNANYR